MFESIPSTEEQINGVKENLREYGSRNDQETILDEKAVLLAMSADNNEVFSTSNLNKDDEITIPADEATFNERFIAYKSSRNQENYSIDFLASVKGRGSYEGVVRLNQSAFMRGYRLVTSKGDKIYPGGEPAEDFQNAYSCAYFAFSALRGKIIKVIDVVIRECWCPKRDSKPPYSYDEFTRPEYPVLSRNKAA